MPNIVVCSLLRYLPPFLLLHSKTISMICSEQMLCSFNHARHHRQLKSSLFCLFCVKILPVPRHLCSWCSEVVYCCRAQAFRLGKLSSGLRCTKAACAKIMLPTFTFASGFRAVEIHTTTNGKILTNTVLSWLRTSVSHVIRILDQEKSTVFTPIDVLWSVDCLISGMTHGGEDEQGCRQFMGVEQIGYFGAVFFCTV